MTALNNPHDRFFKATWTRKAIAAPFFARYLPTEISTLLDLSTLRPSPTSFVNPILGEHQADVLYEITTRSGTPALIYGLLEHKSTPSEATGLQLYGYLGDIWQQARKQGHPFPLPPIIAIVLYHGTTPWSGGETFQKLINTPEPLTGFTPHFRYLVCDLNQQHLDVLKDQAWLAIALQVLKYIHRDELNERLPDIIALFNQLWAEGDEAMSFLQTVLRYLGEAAGQLDDTDFWHAIKQNLPTHIGEQVMTTIAETWRQKGEQLGKQLGEQLGKQLARRDDLRKLLNKRFGELPETIILKLSQADEQQLTSWFDRALDADNLDEVFS